MEIQVKHRRQVPYLELSTWSDVRMETRYATWTTMVVPDGETCEILAETLKDRGPNVIDYGRTVQNLMLAGF
jgi:hypothetical protein